jgi:hypothetical protein
MLSLTSLRHTSTLPIPAVRCAQIPAIAQLHGELVESSEGGHSALRETAQPRQHRFKLERGYS